MFSDRLLGGSMTMPIPYTDPDNVWGRDGPYSQEESQDLSLLENETVELINNRVFYDLTVTKNPIYLFLLGGLQDT